MIERLKAELKKKLPGKEAHLKMMPEGRLMIDNPISKKNAAVAIVIFSGPDNINELVFIKRTEYDGHHSGQVSFPGGKEDPEDESLLDTAIRECLEEVGVKLTANELIGSLSPIYVYVSGFMISPFVFYLTSEPSFNMDKTEVNYIIRFPLEKLTDVSLCKEKPMNLMGENIIIPYFDINDEIIWGATAMILSELIEILKNMDKKNPER